MKKNRDRSLFEGDNTLEELGEFGLIERISGLFDRELNPETTGIGDDCAVLPFDEERSQLITTDMLIENRHFRREWTSPEDLGYKSLAVNLSDISAMGGVPTHAFLSIGLPSDLPLNWLEPFFRETQKLAETYNVYLAGGDTTRSREIIINYTILGFAEKNQTLLRSGAKTGDVIALLGKAGESGAGLKLLSENRVTAGKRHRRLIRAHLRPDLFLQEARFLAGYPAVHSMIDLSDGALQDAGHIARRSGLTLTIDVDKVPLSSALRKTCEEFSWDPIELALAGGEDYGLLFTLSENQADRISDEFKQRFRTSFSIIGNVAEGVPKTTLQKNGKPWQIEKKGFDHFKK